LDSSKSSAYTAAKGGNHSFDFFISQNSVQPGFFNVQNFTSQGKNCLVFSFPALLGRAAGRISLYEKYFAKAGSFSEQSASLPGNDALSSTLFLLVRSRAFLAASLALEG
jgi:hypothetical protein